MLVNKCMACGVLVVLFFSACSPPQLQHEEAFERIGRLDSAVGQVLAKAVAKHGLPHDTATYRVEKISRLYTSDARLEKESQQALLLNFWDRSKSYNCTSEGKSPIDEGAWYAATLPWRLLDDKIQLKHLAITADGVDLIEATYPTEPEEKQDVFIHKFDATGKHISYTVSHTNGKSYLITNTGFERINGLILPNTRTSSLQESADEFIKRADYDYNWSVYQRADCEL